jgi:hypothetical protein
MADSGLAINDFGERDSHREHFRKIVARRTADFIHICSPVSLPFRTIPEVRSAAPESVRPASFRTNHAEIFSMS